MMSQVFQAPELPEGYFFRITPYVAVWYVSTFDIRIELMKRGSKRTRWYKKDIPDMRVDYHFSYSDRPERILYWMNVLKTDLEKTVQGPVKNRYVLGDYPPKRYI